MVKRILLFLSLIMCCLHAYAQRSLKLRNLWAEPEVHVLFEGYTLSFTIKDINKALMLLEGTGDHTFGTNSGLDSGRQYIVELYPGRVEYKNRLQAMMHADIAGFLLSAGHAEVRNPRHRKLDEIILDIQLPDAGEVSTIVRVFDPKNDKMLFWGKMNINMYNKDLGID